jgi:hypothetical protein
MLSELECSSAKGVLQVNYLAMFQTKALKNLYDILHVGRPQKHGPIVLFKLPLRQKTWHL